jgi:hypothetical protein
MIAVISFIIFLLECAEVDFSPVAVRPILVRYIRDFFIFREEIWQLLIERGTLPRRLPAQQTGLFKHIE